MRRIFYSAMILSSLVLGLASCGKDGEKGATGAPGAQGPQGPAGANGAPGAAGAKGADGTRIYTGTGIPPAATGAVNDFYLDAATGILYGPKTSAGAWPSSGTNLKGATGAAGATGATGAAGATGATGANGAAGATGATGAAGANGAAGATGATGAAGMNGTNFLAGSGAPSAGTGAIGDFYFDTNTSMLYGPKTSAGWGAGYAIGVTATPRLFLLDISLADMAEIPNTRIATFHDTALVVDKSKTIHSSYALNRVDVEQRIASYPGWNMANGREILFIDKAMSSTGQYLMVPSTMGDFHDLLGAKNMIGREFIFTNDPANAAFMAQVRRAGVLAGLPLNVDPPNPLSTPVAVPFIGVRPGISSGVPTIGAYYTPATSFANAALAGRVAGGLRYGKWNPAVTLPPTGIPGAANIFTFSQDDYNRLTENASASWTQTSTNNAICYWMYAEAGRSPSGAGTGWAINDLVDFWPTWKKKGVTNTGDEWDNDLKKKIDLNTGKKQIGTGAWTTFDAALGSAWTAARATGSVDFSVAYGTPKGYGDQINNTVVNVHNSSYAASQSSIASVLVPGTGVGGTFGSTATWNANAFPATPDASAPAPLVSAVGPNTNQYKLQTWYNTWMSLNNVGSQSFPIPSAGFSYGNGPVSDYDLVNGANGNVYYLTPPAYRFGQYSFYNGGATFNVTDPVYGNFTVPQPSVSPAYPYGGIWIYNGVINVNYRIYNGGNKLRLTGPKGTYATGASIPFGGAAYSYNWTGPKGFISNVADDIAAIPGLRNNGRSYFDGPWPSNQNLSCEGYYFDGDFIPTSTQRLEDVIIKFKIQTIPSNNPGTPTTNLKAK